jgi:uncharacterized protein (TIGR02271 family)
MTQFDDRTQLHGSTLLDRDGDKIGKIDDIYVDAHTGRPEWALVNTGLLGTKSTFVPIADATRDGDGDGVRIPYEKAHVKAAPGVEPDGALNEQEEQALYEHYGIAWASHSRDADGGRFATDDSAEPAGHDVSGPNTDDAMTRSEEELRVGKAQEETGRARLRKYVVTENVTQTVPVQREELRVEREPITDANVGAATDGPAISEEEHEVVLHEERPVVQKEVVPKERVRLGKDTVADERTVSEDVRKEQIDLDEDAGSR